jgi:hypothetical protein
MTKKELSINTKWDEFEMGTCRVFIEVLNKYIPFVFFQDHKPNPTISNKMLQSVNDILDMSIDEFDRLEEVLGKEVYDQSKIKEIHIDQENDNFEGVYSEVIMDSASNSLISVIVKDGMFMCINEGTYFDTLVAHPIANEVSVLTKENRENILAALLSS